MLSFFVIFQVLNIIMKIYKLLYLPVLILLFFTACSESTPPNIVLISMDTLRADSLGCYGYNRETSPNIDAFAQNSTIFQNCYSSSSWTLPAHATLFTALDPSYHKIIQYYDTLDPSLVLLPEVLQEQGFTTAAFVNGGYLEPRFGFDQGFDTYVSTDPGEGNLEVILPKVQTWLKGKPSQPFFLFLHGYDVHEPYHPSPEFKFKFTERQPELDDFIQSKFQLLKDGEMIPCEEVRKLAVLRRSYPLGYTALLHLNEPEGASDFARGIFKCFPPLFDFPDSEICLRYLRDCYDGSVRSLDRQFQIFLDMLREKGLLDNTLVIVISDHGEEFSEHGGLGHGRTIFREMVHVPLIMKFPRNLHKGVRLQGTIGLVDLMPTILDYLKISIPDTVHGKSVLPLFGKETVRDSILAETGARGNLRAISCRTDRWLYVWKMGEDVERLFDLAEDPEESRNVIDRHPDIAARFKKEVEAYLETGDHSPYKAGVLEADKTLQEQLQALGYIH